MRIRTQSPGSDPLIGQTIHEFQIERKLAEGGMGAVYLARHRVMNSALKVIKFLLPAYAKNPLVRQRFHREAEAASKLKHESILGIDNFGELDDGQLFIMVPFLDGQPLDAYLETRGGKLSPYRAFHLVVQLCDALDYAHGLGIIHRDLKPGNVYLIPTSSNPYTLKLLDFGIAKMVGVPEEGPKTQRGIAMGTPGYMAVEQYERADEVTHLADVYSLAVMIWAIVTGRPPWPQVDPAVLYHLQRTQTPERPPTNIMSVEWADILLAGMSVDPSARPQSMRELATALASALPAVGRLPSGAEILASMAPHFVRKAAPNDETVRNAADVDRIGPLLWPPRETAPGATSDVPHPKIEASPPVQGEAQTPAGSPTVNERAHAAAPSGLATTLSAATGVTSVIEPRRGTRWKLAGFAVGSAAVAALATGTIATRVSSSAGSSPDVAAPGASSSAASSPGIAGPGSTEPPTNSTRPESAGAAGRAAAPASKAAPMTMPASPPPATATAHESTPTIRGSGPGFVREPAADERRGARGPGGSSGQIEAHKAAGLDTTERAAATRPPPPTTTSDRKDSAAKPTEIRRSVPEQPRRSAPIDPNDVSGPEE